MQRVIKSLRSLDTEKSYQVFLKQPKQDECFLCRARPIIEYKHWKIVENEFPYDGVGVMSHILTTKEHKQENKFTQEERDELLEIKKKLAESYDMIIENGYHNQSIPTHFHLHLLVLKERKVEIEEPKDLTFINQKEIIHAF